MRLHPLVPIRETNNEPAESEKVSRIPLKLTLHKTPAETQNTFWHFLAQLDAFCDQGAVPIHLPRAEAPFYVQTGRLKAGVGDTEDCYTLQATLVCNSCAVMEMSGSSLENGAFAVG